MGAIITRHSTPIGFGFNKVKYNRILSHSGKTTIHAEIAAMKNTGKTRINNSTLYIYREVKSQGIILPALARPCEMCMKRLKEFGVKKIVYTVSYPPFFVEEQI